MILQTNNIFSLNNKKKRKEKNIFINRKKNQKHV